MSDQRRTVDAIVLAGGQAERMGGVDKPALTVGGISLVQRAVRAAAGARRIVAVGPTREDLGPRVEQTREEPAGSGPVAAIAAGLKALPIDSAEVILVLAADLPFIDSDALDSLVAALGSSPAAFAVDEDGRTQYLFGAWNARELRRRIAELDDTTNMPVRSIVPPDHVPVMIESTGDCDTPDDLAAARLRASKLLTTETVPTVEQARDRIRDRLTPLAPHRAAPGDAYGSTLAEPLVAASPLPPVDISAMDGYAVSGPGPWQVRTEVAYAGTSGLDALRSGEALRIATGAQVPAGTTSIVRDEHVYSHGQLYRRTDTPIRDDTRRAGEDWPAGTELVAAGEPVTAAVVSVALSSEVDSLTVRGPIRARVVLSGNEIRSAGRLEPGQTRDSLGTVLPFYLASCGITMVGSVHLEDSPTAFEDLLSEPTSAHLTIVIGATGGGAADQLRSALVRLRSDIVVERTLVRPGGSQLTAVLPTGMVVLGLPGNPLAAISTLLMTAPAIVDALTGRTPAPPRLGVLSDYETVDSSIARIVPVKCEGTTWRAATTVRTAHLLHSIDHDALALIPAGVEIGEPVELLPLPR